MAGRRDWQIASQWIAEIAQNRRLDILDIGCANGQFLSEAISSDHLKYGIELNSMAAETGTRRGIKYIGTTVDNVSVKLKGGFDVVTIFDVIEHMPDPRKFIKKCLSLLRSNGSMIIATGNFNAPTFRFMGSRYWYASFAEHITFVSPRWFSSSENVAEAYIERQKIFSHATIQGPLRLVRDVAACCFYQMAPNIYSRARNGLQSFKTEKKGTDVNDSTPPRWMTARDHFIVELRRSRPCRNRDEHLC